MLTRRNVLALAVLPSVAFLLRPVRTHAQATTERFYLMPLSGGGTKTDVRRPAYGATHLAGNYVSIDYGVEPFCVVRSVVTASQHSLLAGEADVMALPQNMDSLLGANVTATANALEALNIPSNWITAGHTYRQVLRVVVAIFQFMQRFTRFQVTRVFTGGVTLATQFQALPAGVRTALQDAAIDLGYDISGLSGTNTLRQILKNLGDQLGSQRVTMGGTDL